MEKRRVFALILIGLATVVFILTRDSASVSFGFTTISASLSMLLLAFTALGVFIGLLLK